MICIVNQRCVTNGSKCGIGEAMQPLFIVIAALALLRPDVAAVTFVVLLVLVRWLRSRRSRLLR